MTSTICLLSGPNLDRFGKRQPEIYGAATLADHVAAATEAAGRHGLEVSHLQSAGEADIVAAIHSATDSGAAAIVINAGAFTHYAWAIADALAGFPGPVVELHISNPQRREPWRHTSVVAPVATAVIAGCGGYGYVLAIDAVAHLIDRSPS